MSDEQPSGQPPVEQPAPESSPAPAKSSAPPVPEQPAAAQPSPEEIAAMRERAAQEQLAVLAKRLNAMDTFRLFSEEEIRTHLLPACSVKSYKAGETLVAEGELPGHAFFLISGHVKMVKRGMAFAQMQRRGDIFAVEAVLGDIPTPATIIAVKETTCLALSAGLLGSLKDETLAKFHSILYRIIAEKLAEHLREANAQVIKLQGQNVRLQKFLNEGL